jgi:hypothetical protein
MDQVFGGMFPGNRNYGPAGRSNFAEPGVARDHERKINERSAKSNPIFLAAQRQKKANSRFSMPGWLHNHAGKRMEKLRARGWSAEASEKEISLTVALLALNEATKPHLCTHAILSIDRSLVGNL